MSDEVDRVVEAWSRERADLDLGPMHIWSRVDRLSGVLDARRKRAFSQHGIESWEFDVLAALRRSGEPYRLSPGQLLRETHVTSGTMTNRVDRLAARGAVTRESDPEDGRGVLVGLTEEGLRLVDTALATLVGLEAELLEAWSGEDIDQLSTALRRLLLDSSSD